MPHNLYASFLPSNSRQCTKGSQVADHSSTYQTQPWMALESLVPQVPSEQTLRQQVINTHNWFKLSVQSKREQVCISRGPLKNYLFMQPWEEIRDGIITLHALKSTCCAWWRFRVQSLPCPKPWRVAARQHWPICTKDASQYVAPSSLPRSS